jgi:methylenetetrahydrofolate reductase (NADPH)
MGVRAASGAPGTAVRVGHLRRGRLDPRAHAQHRHAHPPRNDADACAAPDLHRRVARGDPARSTRYWNAGIRHVVALRGDPPAGQGAYRPRADGFRLCGGSRGRPALRGRLRHFGGGLSRSAPEAPDPAYDLDNLRAKIDAGASRAITQFFFDPDTYLRFRDRCTSSGIDAQIVPGILPITRFPQMLRFAERCGASVPIGSGNASMGSTTTPTHAG